MREKRMTRNRWLGLLLFVLYLSLLFYLMFFSEMQERGVLVKPDYTYNLVPFREIRRYLLHGRQIGFFGVLLNLWGNILGFLPLGFILPIFSRRCRRHWYNTVISAYLLSFSIEAAQLLLRAGSCDVDDLILNSFGAFLGYLFFQLVQRLRELRRLWTSREDQA